MSDQTTREEEARELLEQRVEGFVARIKELEDTVLYLSNTLRMHGILNGTEASVALRMYDVGRAIRRETGDDR